MHDCKERNKSFSDKLVGFYFDRIYNPVYDSTTAQSSAYRSLQKRSINKFEFEDGDSMLCVGVGTGNEIPCLLHRERRIDIVGVDMSERALKRAYRKGLEMGREIKLLNMDARKLQFPDESFDKVLCLHVMDFIEDDEEATREILRVLKGRGQFVITFPFKREGIGFGVSIMKDNLHQNISSQKYGRALLELLAQLGVGIVYLPLLLRAKQRSYSRQNLEMVFEKLMPHDFQVEEDAVYMDFIVYGSK